MPQDPTTHYIKGDALSELKLKSLRDAMMLCNDARIRAWQKYGPKSQQATIAREIYEASVKELDKFVLGE